MEMSSQLPTFANLPQGENAWYPHNRRLGGLWGIGRSVGSSWIQTLYHPGSSMYADDAVLPKSVLLVFCYIPCTSHYQAIHSWCKSVFNAECQSYIYIYTHGKNVVTPKSHVIHHQFATLSVTFYMKFLNHSLQFLYFTIAQVITVTNLTGL